ncbi:hypothetical protein A5N73_08090 [Prescottella equi]|nr:hypothetical protein A5N73_08090 [Prescottella equi]
MGGGVSSFKGPPHISQSRSTPKASEIFLTLTSRPRGLLPSSMLWICDAGIPHLAPNSRCDMPSSARTSFMRLASESAGRHELFSAVVMQRMIAHAGSHSQTFWQCDLPRM